MLAYPRVPLHYDTYIKLPPGVETIHGDGNTHVLKLLQNIYGGKNSGRTWNEYLVQGLINIGFKQSKVDECVFFRDNAIFLCYVDDGIFSGPDLNKINKAIKNRYVVELSNDYPMENTKVSWVDIVKKGEHHK